jgi:hypothetical protein
LKRLVYIILFLFLPVIAAIGQVAEKDRLLQVTGIISDEENNPIPGVTVMSLKQRRGTISEVTGIYNVISVPGDTIWFSALGYKNGSVIIPPEIKSSQYTKDIVLLNDTILIKDVVILPWKNYEEFKRAVLADRHEMKPEIKNMYDNLASIQTTLANTPNYKSTPEAAYRYSMQQNADALYTRGQTPANNLLNPFAWAKFFGGLKHGLLKNQKSDKVKVSKYKNKPNKKKTGKD